MAPTILKMLGVDLRNDFDGAPIAYTKAELANSTKHEIVQVEFWGGGNTPVGVKKGTYFNNTYKALRMTTDDNSLYYSAWCSGEHEFYDMCVKSRIYYVKTTLLTDSVAVTRKTDLVQMNNLIGPNASNNSSVRYYGRPLSALVRNQY